MQRCVKLTELRKGKYFKCFSSHTFGTSSVRKVNSHCLQIACAKFPRHTCVCWILDQDWLANSLKRQTLTRPSVYTAKLKHSTGRKPHFWLEGPLRSLLDQGVESLYTAQILGLRLLLPFTKMWSRVQTFQSPTTQKDSFTWNSLVKMSNSKTEMWSLHVRSMVDLRAMASKPRLMGWNSWRAWRNVRHDTMVLQHMGGTGHLAHNTSGDNNQTIWMED